MGKQARYLWLDGARGIAALSVMLFHFDAFIGVRPFLASSYLAVDLFFLMSGFVIAHAYEDQLATGRMSFRRFLVLRLIRLYPLYAVGTLLGFGYYSSKILLNTADAASFGDLIILTGMASLFLPNPGIVLEPAGIYPYTGSAWSLSLEILVNLIYASFLVRWKTVALMCLAIAAGSALAVLAASSGSFDFGWGWSTFGLGLIRTTASFTAGIVLYRWAPHGKSRRSSWIALLLATVSAAFVFLPQGLVWPDALMIFILFPLFIGMLPQDEPSGLPATGFHQLGRMSYAIYILHPPLMLWLSGLCKLGGINPESASPWSGLAFALAVVLFAWLATAYFDEPLRRFLNRLVGRKHSIEALGTEDQPNLTSGEPSAARPAPGESAL